MKRSRWLVAAMAGCAMVTLTLIVIVLVILDKEHFGGLVGRHFLSIITGSIFLGALLLLVAAWNLHENRNWRGRTLIAWALVALTSPAFGILFLFPFAMLALTLPVVISVLITLWRTRGAAIAVPSP